MYKVVIIYIRLSKENVDRGYDESKSIKIKEYYQQNCLFLYQPEGISMAVPMKNGGMNPIRVVFM